MIEYKCPYCGQNKYAKRSKKSGKFLNWISVRLHTSNCLKNNKEYYIDEIEGPIHYSEFTSIKYINSKYPNLKATLCKIKTNFKSKGINIKYAEFYWSKKDCIVAIQNFYKENKRIPQVREFICTDAGIPTESTIRKLFGSWNKAIEAAGFKPNENDGYGTRIKAKDGILYRSRYEANFVDKFLYSKYNYIVEPKYPKPYNKFYDWYIPELDLYIELDGGCRPEVIKEKIKINNKLNRNLLIVLPEYINKVNNINGLKVLSGAY